MKKQYAVRVVTFGGKSERTKKAISFETLESFLQRGGKIQFSKRFQTTAYLRTPVNRMQSRNPVALMAA